MSKSCPRMTISGSGVPSVASFDFDTINPRCSKAFITIAPAFSTSFVEPAIKIQKSSKKPCTKPGTDCVLLRFFGLLFGADGLLFSAAFSSSGKSHRSGKATSRSSIHCLVVSHDMVGTHSSFSAFSIHLTIRLVTERWNHVPLIACPHSHLLSAMYPPFMPSSSSHRQ